MNVHDHGDHSEQGVHGADGPVARVDAPLENRIDLLFDRELDSASCRALARELRDHPRLSREVVATRRMLDELARPVNAPDLEARILDAVAHRRRFLPESLRRAVTIGRLAAAVGFVAILTAIVLTKREVPELAFVPKPTPVAAVVDSTREGAIEAVRGAADAVQAMQSAPSGRTPRGYISTELRFEPPATLAMSKPEQPAADGPGLAEFSPDRLALTRPSVVFVSTPEAVQAAFAQASAASPWLSSARLAQAGFGHGLGLPKPATTPWSP